MAEPNETFLNPSRRSYTYEGSRSSGNRTRIILIILGIIILIGLVAYAVIATGGKGEEELTVVPTEAPANTPAPEEPAPTETDTTPSPSTTTPTPGRGTPTPTTSSSVDSASKLDRADLKVAVQNGGGVAGAATKASNALKDLGYDVVSSGNADSFDYEETEIQIKSTKRAYLDLLKKDLSDEDYTVGATSTNYTGTDADVVIIIGQE